MKERRSDSFLPQTRYQLLWDRLIEQVAYDAGLDSIQYCKKEPRSIYKHYSFLRSLSYRDLVYDFDSDPDPLAVSPSKPVVPYYKFFTMLREGTLVVGTFTETSNKIKKMIEELPTFSSFLESNQKDGDVAFEQDRSDSSEEEEMQDGSG